MAFVAEAPRFIGRRVAEDGQVVFVGVAEIVSTRFLVEVSFQLLDALGGELALASESGDEQLFQERFLFGRELIDAQAFALFGKVVPVFALLADEREEGFLFLLLGECF